MPYLLSTRVAIHGGHGASWSAHPTCYVGYVGYVAPRTEVKLVMDNMNDHEIMNEHETSQIRS